MILQIKYTSEIPFKYVHDLIMDNIGCDIEFIEIDDGVDPNAVFIVSNLIQYYGKDKIGKIKFTTFKKELPIEELSSDIFFRGIPFDELDLNGKLHFIDVSRLF